MRRRLVTTWIVAVAVLATVTTALAQTQTVGLFVNDERASDGYTLYAPKETSLVFLLNNDGLVVHQWETGGVPRSMVYLQPDGHLVRAGPRPGGLGVRLQEFDWDGNLVWEFVRDDTEFRQHHDIRPLPNGNILFIQREIKTTAEAIGAGRNPAGISGGDVRPDGIVEIRPIPPDDGEVVWQWNLWDHLVQDFDVTKDNFGVVSDHPELADVNFASPEPDWTHSNSVAYDPEFDQVILSSRNFSEFWVIDHSTTTEEAAGHTGGNSGKGGSFLYRWGNPAAYGRGTATDQKLFGQHDANRIPAGYPGQGEFITFNNGYLRPDPLSSVDQVAAPVDEFGNYSIDAVVPFEPVDPDWSWAADPPESFYSPTGSGAVRLPEGTTLICSMAHGRLFEVTEDGAIVWDYVNPVGSAGTVTQGDPPPSDNGVFKARRYPPDYPAFVGRDLTPGDPIEQFTPPLPVPQGSLSASRVDGAGVDILAEWDSGACMSTDHHVLYGPLSSVSSYELSGAECAIGFSGSYLWTDVPAGSLYFLVVGTDDTGVYESSWGRDGAGNERFGTKASFRCGTTTKIVSSNCP